MSWVMTGILLLAVGVMIFFFRRQGQMFHRRVADVTDMGSAEAGANCNASVSAFSENDHDDGPTSGGARMQRPRATINARMLETLQKNPDARGWTVRKWTEYLKCSRAGVHDTETWRQLSALRELERVERAVSKRHNRRPLR